MALQTTNIRIKTGLGLALVLPVLLSLTSCGKDSQSTQQGGRDVSSRTVSAKLTDLPRQITATGSVHAERSIMVSTRMMGWVNKIHVVEGQSVAKGDPLISIDDTDLRAKRAQAEAGITEAKAVLANAQKMAERFERLYADKSVSRSQLDDVLTGRDRAAAGVDMATAALSEVKVHLSYLDVTAPSAGVIARKMIEEGDMASPGRPLLSLEQTDRVKIVAHLGEKDVTAVQAGQPVTIVIGSARKLEYAATLDRVIPTANPGSRTYDIEAYLDNSDNQIRSGMFARMTLPVGERTAVLIPSRAVVHRGQLTGVWIVDEQNIVSLRWIRLGRPQGLDVEVLSGLEGTETLAVDYQQPLVEGDRVVN